MLTADDLLLGPRGRGLCLELACSLSEQVSLALHLDHGELVWTLERLDPTPVADWVDPTAFLGPVAHSVQRAMYWQEPDPDDVVAADTSVVAALRPLAEAVTASPAAEWWDTPVDLDALRHTSLLNDKDRATPPPLTGARDGLSRLRAMTLADEHHAATRRPSNPRASWSGNWWSTPAYAGLITTTRPLPGLGSIHLVWEEDDFAAERAAIWRLTPTRPPRVWELDGPQSWVDLVDRYPLDVTNSRRHDWYRTTGLSGPWQIPDWQAVATEWDAVHLTVAGYLTTATRALPLADNHTSTVLAGWNPDQTWWLNDALAMESTEPDSWHYSEERDGTNIAWLREPCR